MIKASINDLYFFYFQTYKEYLYMAFNYITAVAYISELLVMVIEKHNLIHYTAVF